jgi:two-component system chemotaxis response regulator CheB
MPEPIRVLIVDDSAVVRRAVTDALSDEPEIRVVETASNGRVALEKVAKLGPEVLILDIEMPEANGFDVLRVLKREHPQVRTIMFSTLTQRGASQTVEALALGASDYITKPTSLSLAGGQRGYREVLKEIAAELIPKIKQFRPGAWEAGGGRAATPAGPARYSLARVARMAPEAVAMGVSTGGPEALSKLLPGFPKAFPVPIVIVQHMPPLFTRLLAERLDRGCELKVIEGREGMVLEPGTAYIAPGDYHLTLRRKDTRVVIALNQDAPENSCRPAADVLFRSVVEAYGPRAIGVILTGMGQDGLRGLRAMKKEGGVVLAQDQATSVVWGMPSFVVHEDLADEVVSLDRMSSVIQAWISKNKSSTSGQADENG